MFWVVLLRSCFCCGGSFCARSRPCVLLRWGRLGVVFVYLFFNFCCSVLWLSWGPMFGLGVTTDLEAQFYLQIVSRQDSAQVSIIRVCFLESR